MNYMSSASYPLHQSSELLYQISNPSQQQTINHQDNIIFQANPFSFLEDNNNLILPIFNLADHNKYKPAASSNINSSNTTTTTTTTTSTPNKDPHDHQQSKVDDKQKKMVIRRDVERQRRQEMANLYALLRSLLPLEYIKGKRSISDHMNEAANYIKHLQKRIEDMKDKRDGLKRLSNYSNTSSVIGRESSSFSHQQDFVTVQPCFSGLEVVISSSFSDGLLPLSRVLQALLEDGLTVVSYVSTRSNERSIHTIQAEVSNPRRINTMELQQKLTDLIQSAIPNAMFAGTVS